jgi:predicted O-linked N-acetylglucosamine transferase (SPINDLY family)
MQERFEDALPPLRRAAELDPTALDTQIWLARTLHAAGYKEESVQCYRSALTLRPNDAALYNQLGIALHDSGDSEAAITAYRRAIELEPELAQAHSNIGVAQFHLKRYEEALASYRQALAIEPDFAVCRANLGIFLRAQGQLEAAIEEFRHARTIRPDYLDAHINLSAALSEAGKLVEAVEACYAALEINPDFMHVHSNLLFCLSHLSASDPAALFAEHLRFGARFETPLMRHWPAHSNDRDPERMLRIGFVSGDFNRHAVANFIVPVFEFLTRSPRLSLYAYYTHNEIDATTQRVKTCLGNWRQVDGRSDEELAEQIRDDAIDILIDLSGHTDKNRLLVFARKPAPVQVTWIGYPGTTGLKSMDYFLTDRHLLPPEFSSQFTEAFAYIPASAPFLPSGEAPETNALPALTNGYVTFGSFNRANKLSREVIDLWSALLHAVPNSRLLLAAMPHNTDHQIFVDWFEENGIGGERLSFAKRSDMKAYLQMHHQVDVALDTFPYTGGTTTLHALWMGVPVLTLAGATTAGRTSAAILSHVQLEAFIAHTQAQFVERGTYISNNLPLLAGIRASMRQFMASSAMGQPDLIAIGFEGAMRAMWHRWCAGLPPEMLEVELDPHGAN